MQRIIAHLREAAVSLHRHEHVGSLAADLEVEEAVVLEDADMALRAFDHGGGVRLAIAFEQVAFEAAGVDADAHRAAVVDGGAHHLAHAVVAADIARIDAKAGRSGLRRFYRSLVVEMNVRNDRHADFWHDLLERESAFTVGAGHAHDVGAGDLEISNLLDGPGDIGGQRIGHRLHRDRCVAADGDLADENLARLAARDSARCGTHDNSFRARMMQSLITRMACSEK